MTKYLLHSFFVDAVYFAIAIAIGAAFGFMTGAQKTQEEAHQKGYEQGKIDGFKEAQSADLIADRCVVFWFGSEREGAKTMQRYCKIQGDLK